MPRRVYSIREPAPTQAALASKRLSGGLVLRTGVTVVVDLSGVNKLKRLVHFHYKQSINILSKKEAPRETLPSNSLFSILCTIARPSFLLPPAARVSLRALAYK